MTAAAAPTRIQRRRTKGWQQPTGAVYVGRPSRFGNPWVVIETGSGWVAKWHPGPLTPTPPAEQHWIPLQTRHAAHEAAVRCYAEWLGAQPEKLAAVRSDLAGLDLVCWCPLDMPCHADVLLELANAAEEAN